MGLEAELERKLCKWAKEQGCKTYKFTSPANRGVADQLLVGPHGDILFLELKAPGKKPTALQNKFIADIRAQKANADWADNFEQGKKIITSIIL